MRNQKMWALSLVLVLVLSSLTACMAGGAMAPEREISISTEAAMDAQNAGMAGLMSGNVEWTEEQFSSFLTVLLQQNTGDNFPVEAIHAWFEPDNKIFIRVALMDDVLLGSDNLDLAGTINAENGQLMVDITEAAANGFSVSGAMLAPISQQINASLAGALPGGLPLSVETQEGTLMISMGM